MTANTSFDSHLVVSHVAMTAIMSPGCCHAVAVRQLKGLFVVVYPLAVNALVDIVGPSLSPSLEIHDLRLGETIGGKLFIRAPLGRTQPRREAFQAELSPGKATTQRLELAL